MCSDWLLSGGIRGVASVSVLVLMFLQCRAVVVVGGRGFRCGVGCMGVFAWAAALNLLPFLLHARYRPQDILILCA